MNRYSNESSKNTNVKSEINKVSTNKRCQFLENIVPVKETSEKNPNEYCKVKFTLEQVTKAQRGSRGTALLFL